MMQQTRSPLIDDVKVIHNDGGMWQQVIDCLFIGLPHVHTNAGYSFSDTCGQVLQVVLQSCFITVSHYEGYPLASLENCKGIERITAHNAR